MKRKQTIIIILVILIIGTLAGIIAFKSYINHFDKLISDITISNVNLAKVPDGTYTGSYKAFPVAAEVKVTVKGHRITEIDLVKHDNGRGTAAEILPGKVLEAQTLNIDMITGATISSKVILKAIEDALSSAFK